VALRLYIRGGYGAPSLNETAGSGTSYQANTYGNEWGSDVYQRLTYSLMLKNGSTYYDVEMSFGNTGWMGYVPAGTLQTVTGSNTGAEEYGTGDYIVLRGYDEHSGDIMSSAPNTYIYWVDTVAARGTMPTGTLTVKFWYIGGFDADAEYYWCNSYSDNPSGNAYFEVPDFGGGAVTITKTEATINVSEVREVKVSTVKHSVADNITVSEVPPEIYISGAAGPVEISTPQDTAVVTESAVLIKVSAVGVSVQDVCIVTEVIGERVSVVKHSVQDNLTASELAQLKLSAVIASATESAIVTEYTELKRGPNLVTAIDAVAASETLTTVISAVKISVSDAIIVQDIPGMQPPALQIAVEPPGYSSWVRVVNS